MTCKLCDLTQDLRGPDIGTSKIFVRVDNANVEVVACSDHAAKVIEAVREAQR